MNNNLYDSVPYKTRPQPQTHPDRLAALAILFGMQPCAIRNSRVLELGCGDGSNLIPMALGLSQSEFIGVDLAEAAIARGQAIIDSLGLKNITLLHKDMMDVSNEMGQFDYIIAHGVFSWTPPAVQEKLLSICQNNLASHGVAYLSYNVYPGWRLRGMVREIVRFHADHFPDPEQKAAQARSILKFIADAVPSEKGGYRQVLAEELEHLMHVNTDYVYHGQLAKINQPVYFHEFITQAAKHGLKYLAETDFFEMQDLFLPPEAQELLGRIAGGNIVVKEQFLDFIKGRKFRQTLLCHDDASLNRTLHPQQMQGFYFSSPASPVNRAGERLKGEIPELMGREDLTFHKRSGSMMDTDVPVARAALLHLAKAFPARVHFRELLKIAQEQYEIAGTAGNVLDHKGYDEDALALGDVLLSAFSGNIVELHAHAPHFARTPGERPIASPLARLQARRSSQVTSLCHHTVELENTYGQPLLPLLDGTRDRGAIRTEMVEIIRSNDIPLNGKLPSEKSTAELIGEIDRELENCGRYALLLS